MNIFYFSNLTKHWVNPLNLPSFRVDYTKEHYNKRYLKAIPVQVNLKKLRVK